MHILRQRPSGRTRGAAKNAGGAHAQKENSVVGRVLAQVRALHLFDRWRCVHNVIVDGTRNCFHRYFDVKFCDPLFENFVRNLWMTRYGVEFCCLQSRFLITAILENPIIEACRNDLESDGLGGFVFPKPAVDAGTRSDEGAVTLLFSDLVIEFVGLVIVGPFFAGWLDVGFAMEFEEEFVACRP